MTYWNQYRKWNCGIGTSLGIMYYVSFLWWHLCFRLTYKLRCGVVWIKRIIVVRLYIHQIEKNDMQYFWHDVVSLKRSDSLCYNSMWEKQTHLLELFIKFIAKFLLKKSGNYCCSIDFVPSTKEKLLILVFFITVQFEFCQLSISFCIKYFQKVGLWCIYSGCHNYLNT